MSKRFLPKPKTEKSQWSYVLEADDGYWEFFHRVNGKLVRCTASCPFCDKYAKIERCQIKACLVGTGVIQNIRFASKQTVIALKNILDKKGSLKGVVVTLKGKEVGYELVDVKEPAPKKQLTLWGKS